jgi:hypothetical protein
VKSRLERKTAQLEAPPYLKPFRSAQRTKLKWPFASAASTNGMRSKSLLSSLRGTVEEVVVTAKLPVPTTLGPQD